MFSAAEGQEHNEWIQRICVAMDDAVTKNGSSALADKGTSVSVSTEVALVPASKSEGCSVLPTVDEGKLTAKAAKKDGKVVKSHTDMLRFSWAGKSGSRWLE